MSNKDVICMAFSNIFCNKVKFLLTSISICVGISSVIIITTIGDIGKVEIDSKLSEMGIDGLLVSKKYSDSVMEVGLTDVIMENFNVEHVMPIVSDFGAYQTARTDGNAIIWGVDDSLYDTLKVNFLFGRCFTENEVNSKQKVAIIDQNLANTLYDRTNIIGKNISITVNNITESFEIIGVISEQKSLIDSFMGENSPSFIYIPYTLAQNLSSEENLTQIAIRSSQDLDKLKDEIEFYFSKNEQIKSSLSVQNISSYIEIISDITLYITLILAVIASISMIVAGIGVLNSMLSSIIERKKEIGIYMALGASNKEIYKIFLTESVMICVFSGIFGAFIGLGVVFSATKLLGVDFRVNILYIILIEITCAFCGVLAGILPAIKASKLNPIDILRE